MLSSINEGNVSQNRMGFRTLIYIFFFQEKYVSLTSLTCFQKTLYIQMTTKRKNSFFVDPKAHIARNGCINNTCVYNQSFALNKQQKIRNFTKKIS